LSSKGSPASRNTCEHGGLIVKSERMKSERMKSERMVPAR